MSTRGRGRPTRNRGSRKTCSRCSSFVRSDLTLCSRCSSTDVQLPNGNEDEPHSSNVEEISATQQFVTCSLCSSNEQTNGNLCADCSPFVLPECTSVECQKCRRIPSTPLKTATIGEIKVTQFGCRLSRTSHDLINLCDECFHFSTGGSSWKNAWPAVILDFLIGKFSGLVSNKPFHSVLPQSMLQQYQHLRQNIGDPDRVFNDLTPKLSTFKNLKQSLKVEDVKAAHNTFCFPEVRCPFGCSEFVGQTGTVPFHYFLNKLDPNFKFKVTNWKLRLRCVRPDWLTSYIHNDMFIIKPHVVIDNVKGLCIATCSFHNGGSNKLFVHPPCNPTGRLPSRNSDRLGPATITYNSYKPAKPNYSSHTYSMGVAKGGFTGISSTTIGCKRKWDIAFGMKEVSRESLCCNNRSDIKPLLQKLVKQGELSQNLCDSISSADAMPECHEISNCLRNTTSVPLESSLAVKKLQESGIEVKYFPIFAHPFNNYGCDPPELAIVNCERLYLWNFFVMFALSSSFHSSLLESTVQQSKELAKTFHQMFCEPGKSSSKKQKEDLTRSLESLSSNASGDFHRDITQLLTSITFCDIVSVNARDDVNSLLTNNNYKNIVIFTSNSRTGTHTSYLPDRVSSPNGNVTYELRSIAIKDGNTIKTVVRHGKQYNCWWTYSSNSYQPLQINVDDVTLMGQIHSNWITCHFEHVDSLKLREEKFRYLEYLGGQGKFICNQHQIPLTVSSKKSNCTCSILANCLRKAAWQCPSSDCTSGVCRSHFKSDTQSERVFVHPTCNTIMADSVPRVETTEDPEQLVELSDTESEYDEFSFVHFATDSGGIDNSESLNATDSGDIPYVHESLQSNVPTHILLNTDCHVLQRHRYRNERNKSCSRILQNIVASTPGDSIPLIYPEATVFPTQYFHEQEDGTITGAVPSSLYNDKQTKRFHFAEIEDHKRTSLLNPNLLQSTDVRSIQTSFDTVFNKRLTFADTRLVLNRGFQEVNSKMSKTISPDNTRLQFDKADSRVRVNELASLLSEEPATFFLTLTCNQKEHFGVGPIFDALEEKYDRNNTEEWYGAVQAEIVLLTRAWYRSAEALMEYIEKSPDKPLGTVTKLWYRYEFQSTKGNLPHIHAVIWTRESIDELKYKVSCSGSSALFELKKLANETELIQTNDVMEIWNDLMTVQTHSCEKAGFRCHKVTKEDGSTICRVPRYPFSSEYKWRKVPSCHSEEALEKLFFLDLAVPSQSRDNTYDITNLLQGGKHEYPASTNEHLSPFNTLLFLLTKSSQNLQLCDEYLSARYIAKYAAGIEERADAHVDPITFKDIKVQTNGIKNIKISGSKLRSNITERKTLVQIIPLVESIWWLLEFNYVYSSVTFVHMNTHEKSERASIVKNTSRNQTTVSLPLHVTKLSTFPPHRNYTQSQLLLLEDHLASDYTTCKMSIFSGRPPALLFVDNPKLYFTWFQRKQLKNPETKIKENANSSMWIDIFGFAVYLRRYYLDSFRDYIQKCRSEGHANLTRFEQDSTLTFLQTDTHGLKTIEDRPVQVVTSNILPISPQKFLIHYVLSYGRFETEIDLFNNASMIDVFQHCKLLLRKSSYTQQDALPLIRNYVLDELKYLPGASRSFDRHLLASFELFTNLVTNNQIYTEALPSVLHTAIHENASHAYNVFNAQKKERCVQACLLNPPLAPLQPYQTQLLNATRRNPFLFDYPFPRAEGQSEDSYMFQQQVFDVCSERLDTYVNGSQGFVKHQMFLGRPGSGKTLVCTMLFIKAVSKGLNCSITCLSGERAQQLGGEHIHKMFKFKVNHSLVPEVMASQSVKCLLRDVTRFTDLERLEVLFIDEVGQLNAELLCAMELVLQNVRDNKLPMGGVLTLFTGDPKQLKPPDGSLVWLSPKMLTNFEFHYFLHYVRAVPGLLREILSKLDETNIGETEAAALARIIISNCVIKANWDDENNTFAMRVFSTRAAEKTAVAQHSERILNDVNCPSIIFAAQDEQSSTGSSIWLPASSQNTTFIDNHTITPQRLLLYRGALLRFTANVPTINARQGQLCLLLQFPDSTATTLNVLIAPPGCRAATSTDETCLLASGWQKVKVSKVFTPVITNKSTFLRRYSFPLKNYVASTIHKCLGDTFPKIVSKVSLNESSYKIWEKEQLLVLLSRVSKLEDITFIGTESDLLATLTAVIQKESCWSHFINSLLLTLASPTTTHTSTFNVLTTNFQPWNIVLPDDNTGFVYILVSTKITNVFYIGETVCLRRRLREHNSGQGAESTRPIERRPWAVLAFVTGFCTTNMLTNMRQRKELERTLNYQASLIGPNIAVPSIFRVIQDCVVSYSSANELNLKVIQCGNI